MRLLSVLASLAILAAVYALDLPKLLGAHPWWSRDVLLYGALPGLAMGLLAQWRVGAVRLRLLVFGALTLSAFGVATLGKARFVASYAEDALAGQFWFFGWIAAAAMVSALFLTTTYALIARGAKHPART